MRNDSNEGKRRPCRLFIHPVQRTARIPWKRSSRQEDGIDRYRRQGRTLQATVDYDNGTFQIIDFDGTVQEIPLQQAVKQMARQLEGMSEEQLQEMANLAERRNSHALRTAPYAKSPPMRLS